MRYIYFCLIILFCFTSCKSSKRAISNSKKETIAVKSNKTTSKSKIDKIIAYSKTFEGTKYKYGGLSRKGLDCSGLIFLAYQSEGITIPRISYLMANNGRKISLNNVIKGDLLFFKTSKSGKRINHVGLVVSVKRGAIEFIHSTSSKGVITSMLSQAYWKKAFIQARRIL